MISPHEGVAYYWKSPTWRDFLIFNVLDVKLCIDWLKVHFFIILIDMSLNLYFVDVLLQYMYFITGKICERLSIW